MTTRWFGVILWLMIVWPGLTSGCNAPGAQYYQSTPPESYPSAVPPSFYGNDPTLEHWYTPPYWNPDAD
jgi:hypothetical protein